MLLFYIRHADPTYKPDSLTPLGKRQAEALAHRLSAYGLDRVYSSSSTRAIETSMPTCEMLKIKEPTILDWTHENYAGDSFHLGMEDGRRGWIFQLDEFREMLCDPEVLALGHEWYNHPMFANYPKFKAGIERVAKETDALLREWGYEHDRAHGCFRQIRENNERIALFAHEGFGKIFLSELLDIPFPTYSTKFCLRHSSMTVIYFHETNGLVIPEVCTMSNDSHLWAEHINNPYNNFKSLQF